MNDAWDRRAAEMMQTIAAQAKEVERLRAEMSTMHRSVVHECCVEVVRLRAERDHQQGRADELQRKLDLWMANNG